jgi:hypothetical protein
VNQARRIVAIAAALAGAAGLLGCEGGPSRPDSGDRPRSRGNPNVTEVPADVKHAYASFIENTARSELNEMDRALAAGDLPGVGTRAGVLMQNLRRLQNTHDRCPVKFVEAHDQIVVELSNLVEMAGAGHKEKLEAALASGGPVNAAFKKCNQMCRP